MKTKMKFSDIAGMLERDEMKEIVGGSGYTYSGGSGGGSNFASGTALGGGGSAFGGSNFNYSGGGMGAGLSSNYGPSNTSYGNSNYGSSGSSSSASSSSSWHATANGMSTSNASDISRFYEFLTGQSNGQNIADFNPNMSQISSFVNGEMQFAAAGTITLPNGTVWGGELNNVNVYQNSDPRSPNYNSAAQTLGAVAFGWDTKTMLSQLAASGDAAGDLAGYFKYLEAGGLVGVAVGVASTAVDINEKGWHDYHTADLGTQALIFGAASVVPVAGWALGAAYFLGNYYTEQAYGEGLYEHLNSN